MHGSFDTPVGFTDRCFGKVPLEHPLAPPQYPGLSVCEVPRTIPADSVGARGREDGQEWQDRRLGNGEGHLLHVSIAVRVDGLERGSKIRSIGTLGTRESPIRVQVEIVIQELMS